MSLPVIALGIWRFNVTKEFLNNSVDTTATVIDLVEKSSSGGGSTYSPRIEFIDANGNKQTVTS